MSRPIESEIHFKSETIERTECELLYNGKFFYEINVERRGHTTIPEDVDFVSATLYGPLDGIYYLADKSGFVQVIDGITKNKFAPNQILVTDRKL